MSFSFNWRKKELAHDDCQLLEPEFSRAVQDVFPGAQVLFFPAVPKKAPEKWQKSLERAIKENKPFQDKENAEIFEGFGRVYTD